MITNDYRYSLVRVSSEDKVRPIDTNSNFIVNLEQGGGILTQVAKVSFKFATVPNVFYNVPSDFNSLAYADSGNPGNIKVISIAAGQYNVNQLITALQNALNASISSGTVNITLNQVTQKLTFSSLGPQLKFYYNDDSTIYNIIGLGQTTAFSISLTMDNPVNLAGESEVYVHSRVLATGRLFEGNGNFSTVGYIPLNQPFGSNCYYQSNDEELDLISYEPKQSARTLQQIDVVLRARDGRVLQLPDNFYFSMILQVYYK